MDKSTTTGNDHKCLFILNKDANYSLVQNHIKELNGFYNGLGWYVDYKHKETVSLLCQNINLICVDFPLLTETFEDLKRQHKTSFYHEKSAKLQLEILKLKEVLNLPENYSDHKKEEDSYQPAIYSRYQ